MSEEHVPRYLSEFDYRWNRRDKNDGERTIEAIQNSKGKRLMYRDSASFAEVN